MSISSSAYIIATGQESYASIAKEYNLFKRELLKFNDLKKERPIATGTIVYICSGRSHLLFAVFLLFCLPESYVYN